MALFRLLTRLNPAQHRLLERHVERAIDTLQEADRLLHGSVEAVVASCIEEVEAILKQVEKEESRTLSFQMDELEAHMVPYLENPFAQALAFNLFCLREDLSHTRAMKQWDGGSAAVSARNLLFLPPEFGVLWDEGLIEKTRLVAIANRNLKPKAYEEVAKMVRTRRKEDLDEHLLKMPATALQTGRRGPDQALAAADKHGWLERFETVEIAEELVQEAQEEVEDAEPEEESPAQQAVQSLRAGLGGAKVASAVEEALGKSPDPKALVEKFLTAHKKSGDPDPEEIGQTLFFAHAGPMQKMVADDKLLLRHFRPVKTQKRGQLFYRLLEVIEELLLERNHLRDLEARGIADADAVEAVRAVVEDLNHDPNRYLEIPDEWLGEVTRRHLYFGSRTRKEGAAFKWFRKIGATYFLGAHKTAEELAKREERRKAKSASQ